MTLDPPASIVTWVTICVLVATLLIITLYEKFPASVSISPFFVVTIPSMSSVVRRTAVGELKARGTTPFAYEIALNVKSAIGVMLLPTVITDPSILETLSFTKP